MKKYFLTVFTVCVLLISLQPAFADSPLTSTPFNEAYKDVPIVKKAIQADGLITTKLMKFLSHPGKPLDQKMAVINQLGWNLGGRENGKRYEEFLVKKYGFQGADMENFGVLTADELLSLAYLTAMDNYFDVRSAAQLAREALKKNPTSYTCQIVVALILAQEAFDTDWCKVYQITDAVRNNANLKKDMRDEAIRIIFDYMDIYSAEC
jgi:hypothetical protein